MNSLPFFGSHMEPFSSLLPSGWESFSNEKKQELAYQFFRDGKQKLLKKDLSALELFHASGCLLPDDAHLFHEQGLALFSYGIKENQPKILILASRSFKKACKISTSFSLWKDWGKILYILGKETGEFHYLQKAKEKYQKALLLSQKETKENLGIFYWDYGLLWVAIAKHSGEALDLHMAIQALRTSLTSQSKISSDFWLDFGNAYLQMALLINDNQAFLQSIDYFQRSLRVQESWEGWVHLAQAYTQLYINSMNEQYFTLAHQSFCKCEELKPKDPFICLDWARLLGESGKMSKNKEKLTLAIEKCTQACHYNPHQPLVLGQWVESLCFLGLETNRLDLLLEGESKIQKATEQFPHIPDLWYAYGICLQAFGTYYNDYEYENDAIDKFQIGLSLDRTHAELWQSLATSHSRIGKELEDLDLLERACKFYSKAIDLKPHSPSLSYDYATSLLKWGELSRELKIIEEAITHFEQAFEMQKEAILQRPEWLFHYAIALDLLGDCSDKENCYAKALEIFHHILLLDPDYPKIHYHIGLTLSHLAEVDMETSYFEKALTFFQLANKQDGEDEKVYLDWGLTHIFLGSQTENPENAQMHYLEAEKKIVQAGQLGHPHAYYHLACLYSLNYRIEEALSLLQKGYDLDVLPKVDEIVQDEWLENVRESELFSDFLAALESKQKLKEE